MNGIKICALRLPSWRREGEGKQGGVSVNAPLNHRLSGQELKLQPDPRKYIKVLTHQKQNGQQGESTSVSLTAESSDLHNTFMRMVT